MLPLLRQCYDSAVGARSLADAIRKKTVGSLTVMLARTVDVEAIVTPLASLQNQFGQLQLRLLRGTPEEITEALKEGEADLAIASGLEDAWDRLDHWPLFAEPFVLVTSPGHRLANRAHVAIGELSKARLVLRPYCDSAAEVLALLRDQGIDVNSCDEITSEDDLVTLLAGRVGAAVVPHSLPDRGRLVRVPVAGLALGRKVCIYAVAGRERTAAANAALRLVRSLAWPDHAEA
jgi:DNA-binding transcriptional LysR family regulator